jgi:hypothetical protein
MTASATGTVLNTAVVETVELNRSIHPTNNTSSVQTSVIGEADLVVTKTQSAPTLQVGETLTYTLRVTNNGRAR